MGLTLTPNPDKQSKFIEVPVGTHLARCYQVIDCGMQLDPYTVGETKYKHKVALLLTRCTRHPSMKRRRSL
jgi:hypothetical protein